MNLAPPTPPEVPPTLGLVAGKYQLVRFIGKGGMGSVWEAQHFKLLTRVAIKFIEIESAMSQDARSRFEKEAMAAATIQSKHAIQVFDHGLTHEGIPYIVMELLVGEPLERRLERLGRLTLQETAKIILQVSRALSRAHERGIVHRDLKPDNVFIVRDADDGEEIAKVLDFGIAKMQAGPGSEGVSSSTKTGAVLGTPFYMSPEQARGLRNVDHRTDNWSLGVIAFRCLTGRLPFDGESVGDLLVKICTAPIPIPSQVAPGMPPAFDAWFARALDRDPDRRFGNVMELANELCFLAGVSVPGPSTPNPYQTGPTEVQAYNGGPTLQTPPLNMGAMGYGTQAGAITSAPITSSLRAGAGGAGKWIGIVAGASVLVLVVVIAFVAGERRRPPAPPVAAASATETAPIAPPPSPSETAAVAPLLPAIAVAVPTSSVADTHKLPVPLHHPGTGTPPPIVKTGAVTPPPPPPPSGAAPKPRRDDPGY